MRNLILSPFHKILRFIYWQTNSYFRWSNSPLSTHFWHFQATVKFHFGKKMIVWRRWTRRYFLQSPEQMWSGSQPEGIVRIWKYGNPKEQGGEYDAWVRISQLKLEMVFDVAFAVSWHALSCSKIIFLLPLTAKVPFCLSASLTLISYSW